MSVIVGMTFALFTDTTSIKNHLQAGTLDATLKRTHLEYTVLDDSGKLEKITNSETVDFTGSVDDNVFGIESEDVKIVPGSYFKAQMQIANGGNVAFTYNVGIKLVGESNALVNQLQVIVTHPDGHKTTKLLGEMANGFRINVDKMLNGANPHNFGIEIRFVDDTAINNAAQTKLAVFDLVVTAVQATD